MRYLLAISCSRPYQHSTTNPTIGSAVRTNVECSHARAAGRGAMLYTPLRGRTAAGVVWLAGLRAPMGETPLALAHHRPRVAPRDAALWRGGSRSAGPREAKR